jgi:hypothetical protein
MEPIFRRCAAKTVCLILSGALAACGSRSTTATAAAVDPSPVTNGSSMVAQAPATSDPDDGDEGRGEDDASALAARARQGFAIAPVALETKGLTHRQRTLVGLGSYLVNAAGDCTGCHTANPAQYLGGGVPFFLDDAGHVVWTRNLTPDPSTGMRLSLDEFKEALRTGRDFHPDQSAMLVVMPWPYLRWESDRDLEAIYVYLRAIPPVSNQVPPDHKEGLGLPAAIPFPEQYTDGDVVRRLPGAGKSFDWRRGLAIAPEATPRLSREAKRAYGVGSYLANATIACNECHTHPDRAGTPPRVNTGAWLTGGTVFLTPPPLQPVTRYVRATSANLEGSHHGFFSEPASAYDRFRDVIRTGTLVDDTPPRSLAFPMFVIAQSLRNLLDQDLEALYAYLDESRRTAGASDLERQAPARYCEADAMCAAGERCNPSTHECAGGSCASDLECGTCQTCDSGACQAPPPTSACLLTAQ